MPINNGKKITDASITEDTSLDGTEKIPVPAANKYALVSSFLEYIRTAVATLTNKTINLTSNTLTGTTAQFNTALSDNDFATLAGSETLTNKTLTTPTIGSFTNATHNHEAAAGGGTLDEDALALTDVTTNNSSTSKHGFLKKLDNDNTHFMDGQGNWSVPSVAGAVATDAIWDAKGDLAGGTGANTAARLAVGTNGQVLTADSAETTGLKWSTVAGTGDVVGPASATDEALARFDSTTGKLIQNGAITMSDTGALTFPDNVRQTFNPGADAAGINVGSIAGDPGTPSNGDLWYDSTANELTARINGANVALGAGSSFSPNYFTLPVILVDSDTNWSTLLNDNNGGFARQSSGAQNDQVVWNVNLPAGTYSIAVGHTRFTNRGIYTVYFDATNVGTFDGYNSSLAFTVDTITGISVPATGVVAVKLKMESKNASASNYYGIIHRVHLHKTA